MRTLFVWLFLALPCVASELYTPKLTDPMLEPWRLRHEEMLDGYGILCMDESTDGTFWFGGMDGIVRYNGLSTVRIPYGDQLLSQIVTTKEKPWAKAILTLEKGGILALVGNSLVARSEGNWKVIIRDVGLSVFVCKLARAPDGAFWLLVPDGLWRVSADLADVSRIVEVSDQFELSSFCFDDAGDVWFVKSRTGQRSRLIHIPGDGARGKNESLWLEYRAPIKMVNNSASITTGRDGLIWYGDRSGASGMVRFDPASERWLENVNASDELPIYSIFTGSEGMVWGGMEGRISSINSEGELTVYTNEQLPLPPVPFALYETSDRRLWMIGRIGLVYSVDLSAEEWVTYERLKFQCESEDGVQWYLEKTGGVVSHDPRSGQWLRFGIEDGVIGSPESILISSHGLLWVAGVHEKRAAIAVYDGARWSRFLHPEFAKWIEPKAVFEAKDGTVWFGGGGTAVGNASEAGGALQYEVVAGEGVRLLKRHTPSLFPNYVHSFAETADAFWVGSTSVFGYDDSFSSVRWRLREPRDNTVAMLVDRQQTLWLAKEHLGVVQRQNEGWREFGTEDGLASLLIADLLLLEDGSILASSDEGISRFDGKSWTTPVYLKYFGMSKRWSSMRQSKDGSIWFNFDRREERAVQGSLTTGPEIYRSTRHRPESVPPETRITEYLRRVSQPGNCYIEWLASDPWGQTPKEKIQYSWRLNGGEWSGYSYQSGRTFLDLEHGQYSLEVRARDQAFNVDPTPDRIEFTVIAPIWMQPWFMAMIVFFVGMILLLLRVIIRIREKHFGEQQLQREQVLVSQQEEREKHLLELDALKTGFFTNISHELRTPITVILGPLQAMLTREEDETKRSALAMMERNAKRISTLITQLLDLRKLEKKKTAIEATEDDLAVFLNEIVASVRPLADHGEVACQLDAPPRCIAWFDPDKFQKIVTNLLSNAIKYTPAGGSVHVGMLVEEDEMGNRWAVLDFVDTGDGISEEHLCHIFERFYRIPESHVIDGSGVGLNLTKELVDLWGGSIVVESPIFKGSDRPGSRFTVRLPIDRDGFPEGGAKASSSEDSGVGEQGSLVSFEAREPADAVDASSEKSMDNLSEDSPLVLIVEDDADIRSYIDRELGSCFRIEVAVNGAEGLEKARALLPDLVVTDLMMPVMDGMGLCRELKDHMETSHIPVIMLTAKASLDSQIDGLETGADDYVTKPFHMALLKTRIHNLLESHRRLRERYSKQLTDSLHSQERTQEGEAKPLAVLESANPLDQEFMDKVYAVLAQNVCDSEFNSERLAESLNMGLRTLQRKVKALTDLSPISLIIELRLKKAAELLRDSSSTVTEIAFEVGFNDSNYFSKQFRKIQGVSPSDYRDQQKS